MNGLCMPPTYLHRGHGMIRTELRNLRKILTAAASLWMLAFLFLTEIVGVYFGRYAPNPEVALGLGAVVHGFIWLIAGMGFKAMARSAHNLRLPGVYHQLIRTILLYFLITTLPATLISGRYIDFFTVYLAVSSGILFWLTLPYMIGILVAFLPSVLTKFNAWLLVHLDLQLPTHVLIFALLFIALATWRWPRMLRRENARPVAFDLGAFQSIANQTYRQQGTLFGTDDPVWLTPRYTPRWHATIGNRLLTLLGASFTPGQWRKPTLVIGTATLISGYLSFRNASSGDAISGFIYLAIVILAILFTASASGEFTKLYAAQNQTRVELALLPGLGNSQPQHRLITRTLFKIVALHVLLPLLILITAWLWLLPHSLWQLTALAVLLLFLTQTVFSSFYYAAANQDHHSTTLAGISYFGQLLVGTLGAILAAHGIDRSSFDETCSGAFLLVCVVSLTYVYSKKWQARAFGRPHVFVEATE